MFTNARIYNYFTNNQTQSYQVKDELINNNDGIDESIKALEIQFFYNIKHAKYKNIEIITNGKAENITNEYLKGSKEPFYKRLQQVNIAKAEILKIMAFVNQAFPEICNLPDTHSSKTISTDVKLEIIIEQEPSTPPEIKVRISGIRSEIFDFPDEDIDEYVLPSYMFDRNITYNPKTDSYISTSDLISGQKPSAISRLIAKVLSHLAVIFRLKNTL